MTLRDEKVINMCEMEQTNYERGIFPKIMTFLILLSQRFVQKRGLIGKALAVKTEVLLFQLTIFDISVVGQQQNGAGLPERRDDPLHQPGLERNILKGNEIKQLGESLQLRLLLHLKKCPLT